MAPSIEKLLDAPLVDVPDCTVPPPSPVPGLDNFKSIKITNHPERDSQTVTLVTSDPIIRLPDGGVYRASPEWGTTANYVWADTDFGLNDPPTYTLTYEISGQTAASWAEVASSTITAVNNFTTSLTFVADTVSAATTQMFTYGDAYVAPPGLTQEEADRRLAETRRRMHKDKIQRARALKKGRRLLVSLLDDLQRHDYSKNGAFTVVGSDAKIYRLRKAGTVHELGIDGKPAVSHCIHLPYSYIDEDTLIALKLMIENDVGEFRRIANSSPLTPFSHTIGGAVLAA